MTVIKQRWVFLWLQPILLFARAPCGFATFWTEFVLIAKNCIIEWKLCHLWHWKILRFGLQMKIKWNLHWGFLLGSAAPKGAPEFLPVALINQTFLEVHSQQRLELIPPQFRFSSVITCAMVFLTQANLNIFPLRTHYRYSTWPALCGRWGP